MAFVKLTRLAVVTSDQGKKQVELDYLVNAAHIVDVRDMGQGGTRIRTVLNEELNIKENANELWPRLNKPE